MLKFSKTSRLAPSATLLPDTTETESGYNSLNILQTVKDLPTIPLSIMQQDVGLAHTIAPTFKIQIPSQSDQNTVCVLSSPEGFHLSQTVGPILTVAEIPSPLRSAGTQLDQKVIFTK